MKCAFDYYTDVGGRGNNEDSVLAVASGERYLFAVADGLGGHDCGEVASGIAVDELKRIFETDSDSFDPTEAVRIANEKIVQKQKDTGLKMRTTVSLVYIGDQKTVVSNVGDTRTYLFSNGRIVFQSTDHSASQLAVAAGEITVDQIRSHDDRNILTRALGGGTDVKVDMTVFDNNSYDGLLICSDGFWEYVLESDMEKQLAKAWTERSWLKKMRAIHDREKPEGCDNNTAVVAFMK